MNERKAMQLRSMPMHALIKKVSGARDRDYMSLPETEEILNRLPSDLKVWYAHIMTTLEDPTELRCGPIDKSDQGYFEIWRRARDRYHPHTRPGYIPPENSGNDDEDGGDDDEGPGPAPGV